MERLWKLNRKTPKMKIKEYAICFLYDFKKINKGQSMYLDDLNLG